MTGKSLKFLVSFSCLWSSLVGQNQMFKHLQSPKCSVLPPSGDHFLGSWAPSTVSNEMGLVPQTRTY